MAPKIKEDFSHYCATVEFISSTPRPTHLSKMVRLKGGDPVLKIIVKLGMIFQHLFLITI